VIICTLSGLLYYNNMTMKTFFTISAGIFIVTVICIIVTGVFF
jgi:hypothetical protein